MVRGVSILPLLQRQGEDESDRFLDLDGRLYVRMCISKRGS